MKQKLKIPPFIAFLLFSMLALPMLAGNEVVGLVVRANICPHPDGPIDHDKVGHRSLSKPYIIFISEDTGVIIPELDVADVNWYEVLDEKGNRIGTFDNNIEFASFVLSQNERVEIRIIFDDFMLCGFLF